MTSESTRGKISLASRITLGNKVIEKGSPVFVIAEAGVNHNGDLELAKRLVRLSKDAGADAVKFQTFKAENLVTPDTEMASYQIKNSGKIETQFQMLKRLELDANAHMILSELCEDLGIVFLSTPFDLESAELLESMKVPAFKIGSSDTDNIPLLLKIAKYQKPIFISSGMSDWDEVIDTVESISPINDRLVVFQCTTNYPCPIGEANVGVIEAIMNQWGGLSGFSDHTMGSEAILTATALGVSFVEKHITLSRNMEGTDHIASIEEVELRNLIQQVRELERYPLEERASLLCKNSWFKECYGSQSKKIQNSVKESSVMQIAKKSLVSSTLIPAGTALSERNITVKRPGTGIRPKEFFKVVGMRAKRDIAPNTLIRLEDLI